MDVIVVFSPLIGAFIAGFFGRMIGDRMSELIPIGFMGISALASLAVFHDVVIQGNTYVTHIFTFIDSGTFETSWALKIDQLTSVMFSVVSVVAWMIHIYSMGYMDHDPHKSRFFAYLSLFTFFMLLLVSSDNLIQLFVGWEGVGLVSYLLIGFWYHKPSACAAAIKAFLVNRVGDIGFALGIMACFVIFGSVGFDEIFGAAGDHAEDTFVFMWWEGHALTIACVLLFIGAMGKSAQLGLHTWLPDAMEGPTPVSALIHAATMVTAGVFMVCRLSPIFEYAPIALELVTYVGAITCFFAATIGIAQNDIKRVIAYSTCSQLGYMFFAAGVSAYQAAIFHLGTHAFFKALLFLCAGSVIHAMHDEQDMRKMGGLAKKLPWTCALMWIGSLALAGIGIPGILPESWHLPGLGFAGFYSKDLIIESAMGAHTTQGVFAYWMGTAAAGLTALYSGRLLFMTFHGKSRVEKKTWEQVHESPWVMIGPLCVLGFGATFGGGLMYNWIVGGGMEQFWGASLFTLPGVSPIEASHHIDGFYKLMPLAFAAAGFAISIICYAWFLDWPAKITSAFRPVYLFLLNKWYFDELYDTLFVRPARYLGYHLWKKGDGDMIDGVGPDGISAVTLRLARQAGRLQSGYVYHYAFAMLVGVVVIVTGYLVFAGG
ncbi:MAG: NADH-quinone oxidoreductase subunit L [Pseudomonadota bacterium]